MSLINKMLQDLDTRNAPTSTVAPGVGTSARPVRAGGAFSEAFWRLLAVLMLASVGVVGWIFWNLLPRAAVTEAAYQAALSRPRPVEAAPAPVVAAVAPAPAAAAQQPAPVAAPAPATQPAPAPSVPPQPEPRAEKAAAPSPKSAPRPEARAAAAPQQAASGATVIADGAAPGTMRLDRALPTPRAPRAESRGEPKLERRESSNPREQADAEYRRGVGFVNQGRIAEGVDSMRAALTVDPTYEAPRQTLVSLLLESRRYDEAAALLQQSLDLNPANRRYARLLARIQLERGDPPGALAVLQKHAGEPPRDADYQALTAAVLQRLTRHKEAVDAYQSALASQPGNGGWLAGLGISLDALGRSAEAMDAYRRARATGALSREVGDYVEQRLRSAAR